MVLSFKYRPKLYLQTASLPGWGILPSYNPEVAADRVPFHSAFLESGVRFLENMLYEKAQVMLQRVLCVR